MIWKCSKYLFKHRVAFGKEVPFNHFTFSEGCYGYLLHGYAS
jgi:hypothetical protein